MTFNHWGSREFNFAVREGQHLLDRAGKLGVSALCSNGVPVALLWNPFEGSGWLQYTDLHVWIDGVEVFGSVSGNVIAPGQPKPFWNRARAGDWGPPGLLARDEALPQLEKWAADSAGFTQVGDCEFFGGPNPNKSSGEGIYPEGDFWAAHTLGRAMDFRLMCAYASRTQVFRYDRAAWDAGVLKPHVVSGPFPGYGGAGVDELAGFNAKAPAGFEQTGWGELDPAHRGRVGHSASRLAAHGNLFAQVVQEAIVEDIWLAWIRYTDHKGEGKNLLRFSAEDIVAKWPAGRGCVMLGRPFAHALIVLVEYMIRTGAEGDVAQLLDLAAHCLTPEGQVYLIERISPVLRNDKGQPIEEGEYVKKLNAQQVPIPAGDPPFQVGFEEQLTLYAIDLALEYFEDRAAEAWVEMRNRMKAALTPFPAWIKFPGHPELDYGSTPWGHMLRPSREIGSTDLAVEVAKNRPYDGPASAAHPSLWP